MSKVKFGRMEPMGAREDGGAMLVYIDGQLAAQIVKEMGSGCLMQKEWSVTAYDVTFYEPHGDDATDRTFWVAQLPIVRNGDSLKGLSARGYPNARAALKAAKDYIRAVCK